MLRVYFTISRASRPSRVPETTPIRMTTGAWVLLSRRVMEARWSCWIAEGNGTMEDLQELEELGNTVKNNSLCALGQTAANPIMSTLAHFRDEYIAHIVDKTCPACPPASLPTRCRVPS